MKTITATKARSDLFNLIRETVHGHRELRITSREGAAVLVSEEDYESLLETLHLLSVPGFKKSLEQADREIESGKTVSLENVFEE